MKMADCVEVTKKHRAVARTGILNSAKSLILKEHSFTEEQTEAALVDLGLWEFISNEIEVKATDLASSLLLQWQLQESI